VGESRWERVDRAFAAMVPDFAREATEGERAVLLVKTAKDESAVIVKTGVDALAEVHTIAMGLLVAWKRAHDGEVKRRSEQERSEQERARGLMRLIVRAWREEAGGQKHAHREGPRTGVSRVETHAPSRMPTD
jgi:hypothetical protein